MFSFAFLLFSAVGAGAWSVDAVRAGSGASGSGNRVTA